MIKVPFSASEAMRAANRLRRSLSAADKPFRDVKVAILGGTTTNELTNFLDLVLLANGYRGHFYESDYGAYFEEATIDPTRLIAFAPDFVVVHTSWRNLRHRFDPAATEADLTQRTQEAVERLQAIWTALRTNARCVVIQNNTDYPHTRLLGNLDAVHPGGAVRFAREFNALLAKAIASESGVLLNDIEYLASRSSTTDWQDESRWFSYKIAHTPEANMAMAVSIASMVHASMSGPRKCLVLDLDNTLWGGVIGDDGVDRIVLGRETALAEAYTAFQEYCLQQRDRGVLLAVCSKNNDEIARQGLLHPDSVLRIEHFSAFRANWQPKHENIASIAAELNIGLDSLVFVDDNPAERALVSAQLPMVAVPDVGADVSRYAGILDHERYFETTSISREDAERAALYARNAARVVEQAQFASYDQYLDSLEMQAEIKSFREPYLERIAQLVNKTNQFNLTTRRYSLAEVQHMATADDHITLYGKLTDRFGDNGLVTVVTGQLTGARVAILDWLMSCRVLKRDMELAMLDQLVHFARAHSATEVVGTYIPTAKNGMVADHYERLGFTRMAVDPDGTSHWSLDIAHYTPRNVHITINQD